MIRDVANTLYALENIGLPLLSATLKAGTLKAQETSKISEMLDQAVLLTHEMEKQLGIQSKDLNYTKSKRTLASIATTFVATRFEEKGQILSQEEIPKLLKDLDFFLIQAEHFNFQNQTTNPNPESHISNTEISPSTLNLKYIEIFTPLLAPIAEFSFGQTEKKLIQTVTDILLKRSKEMFLRLIGPLTTSPQEQEANLIILRVLASLYAETHRAETAKIMHMDEKIRIANGSQMTIDIVWRVFDRKCAMLEALIEGLIPAEMQHNDLSLDDMMEMTPSAPPESPLSFFKKQHKK